MNEKDIKYYAGLWNQYRKITDFIADGSWDHEIEELTDNLREVLEQLYEVQPEDAPDNKVQFRFDGGAPIAIYMPFGGTMHVDYDTLIDTPGVYLGYSWDETIKVDVEVGTGATKVKITLEAKIPNEVMGLLVDCGLVKEDYVGSTVRNFVCGTSVY